MGSLQTPVIVNNLETESPPENSKVFNLFPAQADFLECQLRYPAFVASWATGKTAMGILKVVNLSESYPNNLGIIFRKQFTDLRDSTIQDFQDYTGMKVNSNREVIFPNGSMIKFRHLEEMNNIQNVNLGWFLIEQAEELETDDIFFKLFGRTRRHGTSQQGIIIANTNGHNWIYKLWKLGNLEQGALYEAVTADNASNLDKSFLDSLEILKEKKPAIYNRFVLNSWDEADSTSKIINPNWVLNACSRDLNIQPPIRKVVSIDVARYGDDRSIFYAMEMGARNEVRYIDKKSLEKKSTMETVGYALQFARKHDIEAFAVDEIGVGGGVADRLDELGNKVIFVNASKRSTRKEFYNLRAEIYQNGAEMFEGDKVKLDPKDEELIEELPWATYKAMKSNGVFLVGGKEDIKKVYGRSPDCADAFLIGLWALPQIESVSKADKYERTRRRYTRSYEPDPMAV